MKKFLATIIGMVLLLSGCTNMSNSFISNQDSNEEAFESIIEKNNISSDNYIEYDGALAIALSDKIVVKTNSKYKEIVFENPNNLSADKNFLYFLNNSMNEIYCIDYTSFQVKSIFSTDNIITFYWAVGNGNLFVQTSAQNNQGTSDTKSEFVFNPQTNKRYEKENSSAYQGAPCVAVDLINEKGESITRLFYDDSYFDFDYISNPCRIGDFIYYTKNPETTDKSKSFDSVYVYSIKDKKESIFIEYETNIQEGISDLVIKDIFAYDDYIYLKIGINQSASAEYESLEFRQFNQKGILCKTYKIKEIIDSSTVKFFNDKLYYNDLNGVLNSIDLKVETSIYYQVLKI